MPRVSITVPDGNAQPYRLPLDRPVVTLGRSGDNDIVIDSGSVSSFHAQLKRVQGGFELHDLGSTNGTKLNGERHEVIPLQDGYLVKLGDVLFDFSLSPDEVRTLAAEIVPVSAPVYVEEPVYIPDEAPAARPVPQRRRATPVRRESSSGSLGGVIFMVLAVAAFSAGMAVRFQKDTGTSFVQAVQAKFSGGAKAPAPATAPAEAPAPAPEPAAPAPAE